jgi:hypothetical protein
MRIGKLFRRQTFLTKFECIYKISCSHCFPCARAIQKKARRLKWRKNDLFLYFIMVRFFHSLFYEGGKFKCFTFLTLMGNFFANFYHLLLTLSLTQWFNLVFVQNSLCRKKACKKNVSLMMMCSTKTYKSLTIQLTVYRMIHWVLSTFKLVYGHLNGIFLTGNFAWAFSKLCVNSGQKDMAKFPNFDPCTVCTKILRVSRGVYLPAFWATPPYYSITCFLGHTPYCSYKK